MLRLMRASRGNNGKWNNKMFSKKQISKSLENAKKKTISAKAFLKKKKLES